MKQLRLSICGCALMVCSSLSNVGQTAELPESKAGAQHSFRAAPLTVPSGYSVEVAATPPLVAHPLMADLDAKGRLYVAASAGKNLPRAELDKQKPNFVQRLEDTDGDGVFDRTTIFADRMTFPQGCCWHDGSLYVASSGAIWKLTDQNDDGVADKREKLVGDFGYTGNAADIHGPFFGPDGRIYWCDGRHGHEIKDADGKLVSKGKAARIFSCRTDGTDVQVFCTGGMDNPVEIVFTPAGEMLGTVNLMYARPRGDCLVHWQYGGVYPRKDFVETLGAEFVRTGDLLSEVHNFGHVAVSGLCRYRGNVMGKGFDGSLFITQFNTNRIVQVFLKPEGSSYAVNRLEDFAVSTSKDFHPTDVLQDTDGSLLVIDTGGWFRIGCPKSQVAKSDILGAIYRIRLAKPHPSKDRNRNLNDAAERKRLVWKLRRDETSEAFAALCKVLDDRHSSVRQSAARAMMYWPSDIDVSPAAPPLVRLASVGDAAERRVAAAALAQLAQRDRSLTPALLDALAQGDPDRLIRHSLILGLIAAGDREKLSTALLDRRASVRSSAAIALEQLRRPNVNPADISWLDIPAPSLGRPLSDQERNHLLAVEAKLPAGEAARGDKIFESTKTACSKCHRIKGIGGQVGPDLSTIGRSRSRRDLLESILYPSASFARGFATYVVDTTDGRMHSGIILGERPDELHLGIDKDNSTRVTAAQIEEIRPGDVSIMPQDAGKLLSQEEIAHLVAYLQSLQ